MDKEKMVRLFASMVALGGVWFLIKYEIDTWTHANPLAYAILWWVIFWVNGHEVFELIKLYFTKKL